MTAPVLVTGSTGTVGRAVVEGLLSAGRSVRATATDAQRVRDRFGDRVEAVRFDVTDPRSWPAAHAGVEEMFLLRPPQVSNVGRDMVPCLEAAREAGIRHVVLLSVQGAGSNPFVPHARLEAWLRASGLGWTFVRPSFFMENLSTTHAGDIRTRGELVVPAGRGRTAFVAARDVAAVATAALLDPGAHDGRAWTPTGPEALTYDEVAALLSDTLGRPIRYEHPGALRYARHAHRTLGMPWGMVAVTTAIYTVARAGRAGSLTDDVREVTGRDPLAFAEWARESRQAWETRPDAVAPERAPTRPAVERRRPPKAPFVVVNAVLRPLLRSRAARVLGGRVALLRFSGRRSGRTYETPVGVHDVDGLVTLTNSPWRVNLREPSRVTLVIEGRPAAYLATLVEDPSEVARVYATLVERIGPARAGRQLGIRINVDRAPTLAELEDAARRSGLSVVRYTSA